MKANPLIFREYDIRGVVGKDLTEELVLELGRVFVHHALGKLGVADRPLRLALGRDGRVSSPSLAAAMAEGLRRAGAEVVDVGLVPTPGLYYAIHHFAADGGLMLTGSHNPPDYNGIKMTLDGHPVYGAEITRLRDLLAEGVQQDRSGGSVRREEVLESYLQRLTRDFRPGRALKVILDCGNGATGVVAPALLKRLPGVEGEVLFAEVDGTFPNHHPDPTVAENLHDLKARMKETGAELGIAFDGDGDRIGAVDAEGRIIWGDRMLVLFARDLLTRQPGATVLGDVKCSQVLFDAVAAAGGKPLMWKTGHSLIKAKMKETKAPLGGEMSGHLFFADRYLGYDDALYAAVRLMELAVAAPEPLPQRLNDLPPVCSTPEMRLFCEDERKFGVMERVLQRQKASGQEFSDVDGVRVKLPGGWWLLRVSNTQPALVARAEAVSRERLDEIVALVSAQLAEEGVAFPAWEPA
ncbi:MAG: phosphomannomutase/phosphoglucomutase [Magnetococcales bacterium]|nr:phosphomannomutase/phosphoglucomutase [Magnetococcales bacterium]